MKTKRLFRGALCVAALGSFVILCNSCSGVQNPKVTPVPPVVVDQSGCQAACDNLNRLGCDDGKDIEMKTKCLINAECDAGQTCGSNGRCVASCVTFCRDTEDQGVWLDPDCVAAITACDQIDNCPLSTPKTAGGGGPNGAKTAGVGKRNCGYSACKIDL